MTSPMLDSMPVVPNSLKWLVSLLIEAIKDSAFITRFLKKVLIAGVAYDSSVICVSGCEMLRYYACFAHRSACIIGAM